MSLIATGTWGRVWRSTSASRAEAPITSWSSIQAGTWGRGVEEHLSFKGRGTNNVLVIDTNRYMGEEEYLSLKGRGTNNVLVFDTNR